MSSTLSVRSVVASAFRILDRYASEGFGRLRSTRGEGACGVSPIQLISRQKKKKKKEKNSIFFLVSILGVVGIDMVGKVAGAAMGDQ
jgi:hypothetical protein